MMLDTIECYILIVSFLDKSFKFTGGKQAKASAPVSSQSCQSIQAESGILLKLVGLIHLIFILSCPISIQARWTDFFQAWYDDRGH